MQRNRSSASQEHVQVLPPCADFLRCFATIHSEPTPPQSVNQVHCVTALREVKPSVTAALGATQHHNTTL